MCRINADALTPNTALACCELADEARATTTELRRSGRARARACAAVAAAAERRVVGGRCTHRASGKRAARPGVSSAGGRLCGNLCRLRVGPDYEAAEDSPADEPGAAARFEETDHPPRAHGGAVRQAPLRRHGNARRRHATKLPRRSCEPAGVYRRGTLRRPAATPARL